MTMVLADLSHSALVSAIENSLYDEFSVMLGRSPGVTVYDNAGVLLTRSELPEKFFNHILRVDFSPRDVDARIEETLALYRPSAGARWWVGPASRPFDLAKRLEAHGLWLMRDMVGMALDLREMNEGLPAPPGLVVRRAIGRDAMARWPRAWATIFGVSEVGCGPLGAAYASGIGSRQRLAFL